MSRPLGCLTGGGMLAALLSAGVIALAAQASSLRIFSPGPLSAATGPPRGDIASHAELESECAACHPPFWSPTTMGDRCLTCHGEISAELGDPRRLHGEIATPANCRECHTEHVGAAARLTTVARVDFEHERTGFWLTSHTTAPETPFTCRDCHRDSLRLFRPMACAACHRPLAPAFAAEHSLAFGSDCRACHDGIDRYGAAWQHAATAFPLQGGHAELPCWRCHLRMRSPAALRETPSQCVDCHSGRDVHAGRLGADCGSCHQAGTWQQASIDHEMTGFPLEASHALLDCQECHVERQWWGLPRTCVGCHVEQDAHNGRYGGDCAACHQPTRWQDADFDHNRTAFPLTGAHRRVPCLACHPAGAFPGTAQLCAACHADPAYHAGLFGANCGACHNTTAWKPTPYNGPHTFPLNHGGAGGYCARCHPGTLTDYTCYRCHQRDEIIDKHAERFASFSDCTRCHATGDKEDDD